MNNMGKKQFRSALLQALLIGLPLCFGMFWLASVTPELANLLPVSWLWFAPVAWVLLAVPQVMSSLPYQPTPAEAARESALNGLK